MASLDPRERQLVALLGSGQSEKATGYALGVGPDITDPEIMRTARR